MRRRAFVGAAAGAAALGLGWWWLDAPSSTASAGTESDRADSRSVDEVVVERRDLSETTEFRAEVGFGDERDLPLEVNGIVTAAPDVGTIVRPGDELLRVDDRPVFLAGGSMPLHRELRLVGRSERDAAGDRLGLQEGDDVRQLQEFLVSQGFDDDGAMTVDGIFGSSTEDAVEAWQEHVGIPATGRVDRSMLVFSDDGVRIAVRPSVGATFDRLAVTASTPVLTASATGDDRRFVEVGGRVEVEASGGTTEATIDTVRRSQSSEGAASLGIELTVDDPEVLADDASVTVTATRLVVGDAISVPVRALVGLADGGWALDVGTAASSELVRVDLVRVVDGQAEVDGVDPGTTVVVPT